MQARRKWLVMTTSGLALGIATLLTNASAYEAEDGPARHATVQQVASLQWEPEREQRCNGTVLMMDNRLDPPNKTSAAKYYHKVFALNYLYAQRHGLEFVLIRPTRGPWLTPGVNGPLLCPAWCRVKILASLVASRRSRGCHWIMYIDSDAYVREQETNFVERLAATRNGNVVSTMVAQLARVLECYVIHKNIVTHRQCG